MVQDKQPGQEHQQDEGDGGRFQEGEAPKSHYAPLKIYGIFRYVEIYMEKVKAIGTS